MMFFVLNTTSKFLTYSLTCFEEEERKSFRVCNYIGGRAHLKTERYISASFFDRVTSQRILDSSLILRDLRQQKVKIPTRKDDVNPSSCILNSSF